jgi:ribosomal protein S4
MRLDLLVARKFALSRRAAREAVRRGHVDVGGAPAD